MSDLNKILDRLEDDGFLVADTKGGHYAHVDSFVGVLRRKAWRERGIRISARLLDRTTAWITKRDG